MGTCNPAASWPFSQELWHRAIHPLPSGYHGRHAVQVHAGLAGLEVSDERPGIAALELGDMLVALGLPGQAGTAWQQGLAALRTWMAAMGLKEMQVRAWGRHRLCAALERHSSGWSAETRGCFPLPDECGRPSLLLPVCTSPARWCSASWSVVRGN